MSNREFREIINDVPAPSGSGNRPNSPPNKGKGKECADYLVKIVQEEGVGLIKFLLSAAVSSAAATEKIPEVSKVHERHFRDLMCFPKAAQKEWKIAGKEELEALHRRNVFKLTDLPKGHKTIGCRWVFDVKSDGRKKARLVVLRLRTMCYIEPVLAFGTEQDIIVNSRCLSSKCSQKSS
jgi:hypothetical protein